MMSNNPKIISVGDPQPSPCPKCGGTYGYSFSDYMTIYYTSEYTADGEYDRGQYEDGRHLHSAKTAFCANCGTKLNFKLNRR